MSRIRQILLEGVVSSDNSSDTVLGISEVFTGDWVEILNYGTVFVSVFADQDGELLIEQSTDGVNADFYDQYTIYADESENYAINPHARYLKVIYTNGTVTQTAFRLQTILKGISTPSSHKINDDITGEDDSRLVTSILKVQTNDGETYKNVDIMNPLPADGDSVYAKDLNLDDCITTGWSAVNTGNTVEDLFKELYDGLTSTNATTPKELTIIFRRPVVNSGVIALGTATGSFSNVKLSGIESDGSVILLYDNSADSTVRTFQLFNSIPPGGFSGLLIQFYTTNTVTITEVTIPKANPVIARLQAQKEDGTITDLGATNSGNLKTTDAESGLAIAKGDVSGTTFVHKFGNAPDFDTADGTVSIWDGADDGYINQMVYQYSTTADIDTLSSSNAGDTQDVEVQGLDSNYDLVTQTVTLNGQTQVTLTTALLRIFRIKNVGTSDNAGHIYSYTTGTTATAGVPDTPANVRAIIQPGNNQTLMAIYTIPNGYTGYIRDWYASTAGANKTSNYPIELRARPFGEVFQLKHLSAISDVGSSYIQHVYEEPGIFEEKTDIEMRASMTAAGGTAGSVSSGFDIVLVEN